MDEYDEAEIVDEESEKDSKKSKKKKKEPQYINPNSTNTYWWSDSRGKFKTPRFIKRDMFESFLYDATPSLNSTRVTPPS